MDWIGVCEAIELKDLSGGWMVKRLGKDSEKKGKTGEGSWENRNGSTEQGKALGWGTAPQQRQWLQTGTDCE